MKRFLIFAASFFAWIMLWRAGDYLLEPIVKGDFRILITGVLSFTLVYASVAAYELEKP